MNPRIALLACTVIAALLLPCHGDEVTGVTSTRTILGPNEMPKPPVANTPPAPPQDQGPLRVDVDGEYTGFMPTRTLLGARELPADFGNRPILAEKRRKWKAMQDMTRKLMAPMIREMMKAAAKAKLDCLVRSPGLTVTPDAPAILDEAKWLAARAADRALQAAKGLGVDVDVEINNSLTYLLVHSEQPSMTGMQNDFVKFTKQPAVKLDGFALPVSRETALALKISEAPGPLKPADVFRLSLEVCKGDYPAAMLTAHNFLKEITYAKRHGFNASLGPLAQNPGVSPAEVSNSFNQRFKTSALYLNPIDPNKPEIGISVKSIESKLVGLRPDSDPNAKDDKMGPWYHMFGVLYLASTAKGGRYTADLWQSMESALRHSGLMSSPPDAAKEMINELMGQECGRIMDAMKKKYGRECDELIRIHNASRSIRQGNMRVIPGTIGSPQTLVSPSGSFSYKYDQACDVGPTYGPFEIVSGGRIKASIEGNPPVPNQWSLGNWNTGLWVVHQPRIGSEYGSGDVILKLSGQAQDNRLKGEAEFGSPGRLYVGIGAPSGHGSFFGCCFAQSYSGNVEVTEVFPDVAVSSGDTLAPGDVLKTAAGGGATLTTPDGTRIRQTGETAASYETPAPGETLVNVKEVKNGGKVRVNKKKGKGAKTKVKTGKYRVKTRGTELLVFNDYRTTRIAVVEGEIEVTTETESGPPFVLSAGQQIDLDRATTGTYDLGRDDRGAGAEGIPLGGLLLDDEEPEPYGEYACGLGDAGLTGGWILEDPGKDVVLEAEGANGIELTVPPGNELWDRNTTAGRLIHKATGDFDLEGNLLLECAGNDFATAEFLVYSPGSHCGFHAKQMNREGFCSHYAILGGGWRRFENRNKLAIPGRNLAESPDAPDAPVRMRLIRRADDFKAYWRKNGGAWNLAMHQHLNLPETLWVGWVFKRVARDGKTTEPAHAHLRDVSLRSAERRSMPMPLWDVVAPEARAAADIRTARLSLDGAGPAQAYVRTGEPFSGDLDVIVRIATQGWEADDGEHNRWAGVWITTGDDKNRAYAAICRPPGEELRYATDLCENGGWNRGFQKREARQTEGLFRIVRQLDRIRTYVWSECEWQQLDKEFSAGFTHPVHIQFSISNDDKKMKPGAFSAEFELLQLEPEDWQTTQPWQPAGCSLFDRAPLPPSVRVPPGIEAEMFRSPFGLGNLFFSYTGDAYFISSRRGKEKILRMDMSGRVSNYLTTGIVSGINCKAGTMGGEIMLVSVDGWHGGGNPFSGVFEFPPDGNSKRWTLDPELGGISDILHRSAGGWWISDFERDNIWYLAFKGARLEPVMKKAPLPGICALACSRVGNRLYAMNCSGAGPLGGKGGIYWIDAQGTAQPIVELPGGRNFGDIAVSEGGAHGTYLYATEPAAGKVYRIAKNMKLEQVVAGLREPSKIDFSPRTGDMLVICETTQVLRLKGGRKDDDDPRPPLSSDPARPETTERPVRVASAARTPVSVQEAAGTGSAPTADFKAVTVRCASKSDGRLLRCEYPATGTRFEVRVVYEEPGTVLDTVGIDAAPTGAFALVIGNDGRPRFQVYDPGVSSNSKVPNGWHLLTGERALSRGKPHTIAVDVTAKGISMLIDGKPDSRLNVATRLCGSPLYVGNYPGDDKWGPEYNIHPAFVGTATVLYVGPRPHQWQTGNGQAAPTPPAGRPWYSPGQRQ